jgi:phosphatidylserine/phosphatidylglycerophosphate/cardiolipin synthase-like enzyme
MYNEVIRAKKRVDVTSLTPPDGRFQAMLRNAVTYLSENESPPTVRMIFGQYPFSFVDHGTASSNMKAMTRDVADGSPLQLSVSLYRDGDESWNHAKIVAIDGEEAITGGMNMWTENYLQVDPVHDLSIHLHGSAAGDAERFADRLWSFACADESWLGETQVSTFPGDTSDCLPAFGGTQKHAAGSGIPVVAVGRLGKIGPETADAALVALMDAAKTTIHIAQQDIGPPKEAGISLAAWPEAYMESLVKAIARGVDVEFVVSNVGAVPGDLTGLAAEEANYGNGWSPADVQQHILATGQAHPELWTSSEDMASAMCARLHVTTLDATSDATWPDGGKFALHTKLISVDSQAFYLGSQNMYVANLAEFGFIYDDAATAQNLENDYYAQMWGYSSPGVSCALTDGN